MTDDGKVDFGAPSWLPWETIDGEPCVRLTPRLVVEGSGVEYPSLGRELVIPQSRILWLECNHTVETVLVLTNGWRVHTDVPWRARA